MIPYKWVLTVVRRMATERHRMRKLLFHLTELVKHHPFPVMLLDASLQPEYYKNQFSDNYFKGNRGPITSYGMYTVDTICKMIEFFIDNIFVQFGGRLFRQMIGIPVGNNCAPSLADL